MIIIFTVVCALEGFFFFSDIFTPVYLFKTNVLLARALSLALALALALARSLSLSLSLSLSPCPLVPSSPTPIQVNTGLNYFISVPAWVTTPHGASPSILLCYAKLLTVRIVTSSTYDCLLHLLQRLCSEKWRIDRKSYELYFMNCECHVSAQHNTDY